MEQEVYSQFNELENQHWWFCARRSYLNKIIQNLLLKNTQNINFCEIGSGTGGNLRLLAKYASVDAVEMNDLARQIIKEKSIPNVSNIYNGSLPDNMPLKKQYDAVFTLDVIEHIKDDFSALVNIKEYINKNGFLVTTVPAYQWLWSSHDVANHHYRRYTQSSYRELLNRSGYEVIYSSYFNTLLFPLAGISRLMEKVFNKNTEKDNANLTMPSKPINRILRSIFGLERFWAGKIKMPFGLSIIIVARVKQ